MHPTVSIARSRRKPHGSRFGKVPDSQQAVQLVGQQLTQVRSIAMGAPGYREVRVKLQGCGISAAHLPVWEGRPWFRYPQEAGAPGHEGWGFIDAIGAGVDDLEVGQRVAFMSGHAYAQYDIAPRDRVVALPEELDDEPFPGEPFADAMNVFQRSDIRSGHTVAIVGGGFLGLLLTQLAADQGAHVVMLSRRPFELECAEAMDAEESMLIRDDGSDAERALLRNGGKRFDRVIEVNGTQLTFDLAGQLCAERAGLVSARDSCADDRERYVTGVQNAIQAALEGRLDPFPLMSHSVSMRSLDSGFELTRARPEGFVKALLIQEK
jgi:threonine dehydrogenase-like Zn-dependent dehydrogenase